MEKKKFMNNERLRAHPELIEKAPGYPEPYKFFAKQTEPLVPPYPAANEQQSDEEQQQHAIVTSQALPNSSHQQYP